MFEGHRTHLTVFVNLGHYNITLTNHEQHPSNYPATPTTMVENWPYFFKNAHKVSEKDLDKLIGSDLVMKRTFEELDKFSWSDEELRTYDAAKKRYLDNKAALAAAAEKGEE